jgi:hypothetical protein
MARDDDFNKDNLFGDDDEFGGFEDSDNYDSLDDDSLGFDDEFDLGLGDESDSIDLTDEELQATAEKSGGPSRTFVFLAIMLIIVLLLGLGLIVALSLSNRGPSPTELTSTSIAATNVVRIAQIAASETQGAIDLAATQTATAMFTASPTPSPTPTETLPPTEDFGATQTAEFQATIQAADAVATQNVVASATALQQTLQPSDLVTQQSGAVVGDVATTVPGEATQETSGEAPTTLPTVEISAVQQTATALAILFEATPTPEEITGGTGIGTPTGGETGTGETDTGSGAGETATETVSPGQGGGETLPDTGLFDDVFNGDPALVFLAAFGLLGVIFVSRRLRSTNKQD